VLKVTEPPSPGAVVSFCEDDHAEDEDVTYVQLRLVQGTREYLAWVPLDLYRIFGLGPYRFRGAGLEGDWKVAQVYQTVPGRQLAGLEAARRSLA
jgi:hypothetical protein